MTLGLTLGLGGLALALPSQAAPVKSVSKKKATPKKKGPTKPAALPAAAVPTQSPAEILAAAPAEAWRSPEPEQVVLMELQTGAAGSPPAQVWFELAPRFAPAHAANIRALVRGAYFDGLAVLRVQDNFVTQWATLATHPATTRARPARCPPARRKRSRPSSAPRCPPCPSHR